MQRCSEQDLPRTEEPGGRGDRQGLRRRPVGVLRHLLTFGAAGTSCMHPSPLLITKDAPLRASPGSLPL